MTTKKSAKATYQAKAKPLTIRDEIHGDISFGEVIRQAIDHEAFQRLRHIKQVGLAEYVFPCANHTRFQHSLGASYLAGQYYETLIRGWLQAPFDFEGVCEGTRFFPGRTRRCVTEVAEHPPSYRFWGQVVELAGLLHDVGHGPWSHTFEFLELEQDFSAVIGGMSGIVRDWLEDLRRSKKRFMHEELSVLYIFRLLSDLERNGSVPDALRFFLPVVGLVHSKLARSKYRKAIEVEISEGLEARGLKGGVDMYTLLGPIISGPFDVDRMDYIQRDGRNSGVSIGGIEWRRIVTKLIPCLAEHNGKANEPTGVVLISNVKNHHVLDDFIFSLFQMYAQVYMHPKIVAVEEVARRLLKDPAKRRKKLVIDFAMHQSLTDEKFREMLKTEFGLPQIEDMLFRRSGALVRVVSLPADKPMESELKKSGYEMVETLDRPMMKDSVGVFLFSSYQGTGPSAGKPQFLVRPWVKVSAIAQHFYSINYSPRIWVKSELS